MTISAIKKDLHEYIERADDKKLKACMYCLKKR